MPKLDEIKTRRERITQGGWVFEKQPSIHFDCPNLKHIAICRYVKKEFSSNEITDFIANSPTDIDWLVQEVERLKAEKVQAEAERDVLIYFLNDARREEQARVEGGDYSDMCPNTVLMTPNGDLDWLKYAKQQTEDVKDSTTKQGA